MSVERTPAVRRSTAADTMGRRRGWLWWPVAIALSLLKAHIYVEAVHHHGGVIALLAMTIAVSLLRARLVVVALAAAVLCAVGLEPHPVLRAVGTGAAAFALLLTAFMAISTVLHVRQDAGRRRSSRVA